MSLDEPTQEEWEDAVIEDTVHCDFCGTHWVLGGTGDGIICQAPGAPGDPPVNLPQLKLCMDCAAFVVTTYLQEASGTECCEHQILPGEYCSICVQDLRRNNETE